MIKKFNFYVLLSVGLMVLLAGCAAKTPWYEGYYFDAKINNRPVVKIDEKTLERLEGFSRANMVHWMVKEKVHGDLDVTVDNNSISHEFIGDVVTDDEPEIYVYALGNQHLDSTEETSHSKDTYVSGSAATKTDNVMTSNTLPAGAYVISIKTWGSENWDRKYIYVEFQ